MSDKEPAGLRAAQWRLATKRRSLDLVVAFWLPNEAF